MLLGVDHQLGDVDLERVGQLGQPVEVSVVSPRDHGEDLVGVDARGLEELRQRHGALLSETLEVLGEELVRGAVLHARQGTPSGDPMEALRRVRPQSSISCSADLAATLGTKGGAIDETERAYPVSRREVMIAARGMSTTSLRPPGLELTSRART